MPQLPLDRALEVTAIHQAHGAVAADEVLTTPPIRLVDPTVTKQALLGGGHQEIYPGEATLAHRGVLYIDEILQCTRTTLESMRSVLQDRQVAISRVNWKITFPADFMLLSSCNPCACGHWAPDDDSRCTCTPAERRRYAKKLSGPMIDRLPLRVWLAPLTEEERFGPANGEASEAVAERVQQARDLQEKRYAGQPLAMNSELGPSTMPLARISATAERRLQRLAREQQLSTRGVHKAIEIGRTIADLRGAVTVEAEDIEEAAEFLDVPLPVD